MNTVLVVNSGSSSFKYQLIDGDSEHVLASGLVERIGPVRGEKLGHARHTVHADALASADGPAPTILEERFDREEEIVDHEAGFALMLQAFEDHGPSLRAHPPTAIGHRVVHGGARFFAPTLVDDGVELNIQDLSRLAPLHNPGAVQGIRAAREAFPDRPHITVFDTAFHQSIPAEAYTYAIDKEIADAHRIRKYGFHGTSHKYVSETAAAFLGRPLDELRQIVLHLGNGASAAAIRGGESIDTSMGLTPLEGLVMGTRSGDLDPAVLLHLARRARLSTDDLDRLLNKDSGLLGLAGVSDMRDVDARRQAGDPSATLAFDVYIHRLRAYIGAYIAQLGGVDVIAFTAGVGENSATVRAAAVATLGFAGVELDEARNEERSHETRLISTDASAVAVLVVPTNEELEIARQSLAVARAL